MQIYMCIPISSRRAISFFSVICCNAVRRGPVPVWTGPLSGPDIPSIDGDVMRDVLSERDKKT
jgi:hypothetical protein